MSSHGKDEVEILFLDYGNREVVNKSDLKQLEEQHRLHSWLAIKVHLPMVSRSGFNTEQQCIKDLSEKYFEVTLI